MKVPDRKFVGANQGTERTTFPLQPIRVLKAHDVSFVRGRRGKLNVESRLKVAM